VIFIVGGRNFGGLRNVLSLRCDVLASMRSGNFKEATAVDAIPIPQFDSDPDSFREFLVYLHTGFAPVAVKEKAVTLYEIAHFFDVPELKTLCGQFIDSMPINVKNVISILKFAMSYDFQPITEAACALVALCPDVSLEASESAACLPSAILTALFGARIMTISKIALVRILMQAPQKKNRHLKHLIRLRRVSARDMMKTVVPSGLFDPVECLAALAYAMDPTSVKLSAKVSVDRCGSDSLDLPRELRCDCIKASTGLKPMDLVRLLTQTTLRKKG